MRQLSQKLQLIMWMPRVQGATGAVQGRERMRHASTCGFEVHGGRKQLPASPCSEEAQLAENPETRRGQKNKLLQFLRVLWVVYLPCFRVNLIKCGFATITARANLHLELLICIVLVKCLFNFYLWKRDSAKCS